MRTPDIKALLEERGLKQRDIAVGSGCDKSTVSRWLKTRIPAERVADVERITGISRHDLRPDIFGPAPSEAAQ